MAGRPDTVRVGVVRSLFPFNTRSAPFMEAVETLMKRIRQASVHGFVKHFRDIISRVSGLERDDVCSHRGVLRIAQARCYWMRAGADDCKLISR